MNVKSIVVVGMFVLVLAAFLGLFLVNETATAEPPPSNAQYVGTAKCRACHFKEYGTWKKTKHAVVFDALVGDEKQDPDCLKCHTTGYGEGGFTSESATAGLKNVGCESCHGPGSAHTEAAASAPGSGDWDKKINKVPQNTCVKCHNPHVNQKERVAELRKKG